MLELTNRSKKFNSDVTADLALHEKDIKLCQERQVGQELDIRKNRYRIEDLEFRVTEKTVNFVKELQNDWKPLNYRISGIEHQQKSMMHQLGL